MGAVRKTISLTEQQDEWVKAQIDAGLYTTDSECIRDLIRREQDRDKTEQALRKLLAERESKSGSNRTETPA